MMTLPKETLELQIDKDVADFFRKRYGKKWKKAIKAVLTMYACSAFLTETFVAENVSK